MTLATATRTCSVPGCQNPVEGRTVCDRCRARIARAKRKAGKSNESERRRERAERKHKAELAAAEKLPDARAHLRHLKALQGRTAPGDNLALDKEVAKAQHRLGQLEEAFARAPREPGVCRCESPILAGRHCFKCARRLSPRRVRKVAR